MKFENKFDEGVSPVVGVILMVAITVILSAIIATFVLDLGGTVSQNPQAGVTFDQSNHEMIDTTDDGTNNPDTQAYQVDVQVVSMENADTVSVDASDTDNSQVDSSPSGTANDGSLTAYDPTAASGSLAVELSGVGNTATVQQLTDGDTITVTATLEGKTSVIQTYTVDG